ncbi:MAG: carboxypeptidase M32 [Chitinophagales bacterium]
MNNLYQELKAQNSKIADIKYALSVLSWDQETYMPPKGKQFRAQQIATLSELAHNKFTAKEYNDLLYKIDTKNLSETEKRNVELLKIDIEKLKKIPSSFIVELSNAISNAYHAWMTAKKENNFKLFEKELGQIIDLQRKKADIVGYEQHPYDALMDDYEPNAKVADIDILFADVRQKLQPLLNKIMAAQQVDDSFMYGHFDKDKQWNFGIEILKKMGYDMDAGRQDISAHPFTTTFSPQDVRVTTRIDESNFYDMLWSCIHEGGHALYEQGLPAEEYGLPCGEAVSLGVHESQSRFYENNIGRSYSFWKANYQDLQKVFPDAFAKVSLDEFYKAINIVKPSLIRTDADELTYHFHIMIRYELEKQLIEGTLKVKDAKEAWNAKYKEYLNIDVPNDSKGILQDIHWSHGSFGYFPTYSLGSFYTAQFDAKIHTELANYQNDIENNNLSNVLNWLRKNVHQYGRFYYSNDLCKKATGETLNFSYFMQYAENKYGKIYGV